MTTPTGGSPADIVNDVVDDSAFDNATPFNEHDAPSATELVAAAPAMVNSAPRVVLVGLPGSGKSTIGRRVASALNPHR